MSFLIVTLIILVLRQYLWMVFRSINLLRRQKNDTSHSNEMTNLQVIIFIYEKFISKYISYFYEFSYGICVLQKKQANVLV